MTSLMHQGTRAWPAPQSLQRTRYPMSGGGNAGSRKRKRGGSCRPSRLILGSKEPRSPVSLGAGLVGVHHLRRCVVVGELGLQVQLVVRVVAPSLDVVALLDPHV